MAKKIEKRLQPNLLQFFQSNTMTGVASTIDMDGYPRGAPMSLFYALNDQTLLMGTQNRSQTFQNAQRTGTIALTFIGGGDAAFTIRGRVRVFKEKMTCSDYIGILVVNIEAVKSDVAVDVEVTEGIKISYRSPKWEAFIEGVLAELRSYTLTDIQPA